MPSSQPAAGHLAVKPEYLSSQPSPMAKRSEPNRSRSYDPRVRLSCPVLYTSVADSLLPQKTHIADTKMTSANWYKHVNWLNTFLIVGIPLIGLVTAFFTPLYWQTAVWAIAYYFATVRLILATSMDLWLDIVHAVWDKRIDAD